MYSNLCADVYVSHVHKRKWTYLYTYMYYSARIYLEFWLQDGNSNVCKSMHAHG